MANLILQPYDRDTGEIIDINPNEVDKLQNDDLAYLLSVLKAFDKTKKKAEEEIKKRLDEGQSFARLSYGNPTMTRVLKLDDGAKKALIKKYGWDSVEPLSITQLEKKYGEEVYKDLESYIVQTPRKPSIQWDK